MFKPLSICLGLRYNFNSHKTGFVSFLSFASMIGVALGVAILITVLSVMNGFDHAIKQRFFSVAPQVTLVTGNHSQFNWASLQKDVQQVPGVKQAAPYINGKGMLSFDGGVAAASILGVIPTQEERVSDIVKKMVVGKFSSLQPGKYHIVLGQGLAEDLGVLVGDSIILLTPQASTSPLGILPRYRQFTVSGIFKVGAGFGMDSSVAFINYQDGRKLFVGNSAQLGLHITVNDIYQAPHIAMQLQRQSKPGTFVHSWADQFGAFFHALSLEKTMMFFILLLIIAIAAFNLVSGMVMVVNDKQGDIAILRTLGLPRKKIMASFMVQGLMIGLVGVLLGAGLGIVLSFNATAISNFIQHTFHVQLVNASVYFVNYLPSRLQWSDVALVMVVALLLTFLATLYPAWRAFKTQPAEALKYE